MLKVDYNVTWNQDPNIVLATKISRQARAEDSSHPIDLISGDSLIYKKII